jgi:hypothetical protein
MKQTLLASAVLSFALALGACSGDVPGSEDAGYLSLAGIADHDDNDATGQNQYDVLAGIDSGDDGQYDDNYQLPGIDAGDVDGNNDQKNAQWNIAGKQYSASSFAYFIEYDAPGIEYIGNVLQVFAGFDFQDFNPTNDLRGSFSSLLIQANNIEKSSASYAIPEKAKITVFTVTMANNLGGYQLRSCASFDQDESPAGVSANGTLTISAFNTRRVEGHFSVDLDCSYGFVAFGDSPGDISYEQSRLLSGSFSSALLPPEGEFSF